jgi:hypothetical protein
MVLILLWIIGLILLCRGKAYLGRGCQVEGKPARVAGAVMMMALPFDLLLQLSEMVAHDPRLAIDWGPPGSVTVLILAVHILCAFIAELILRSHSVYVAEMDETPCRNRRRSQHWQAGIVEFACYHRWSIGLSLVAVTLAGEWISEALGVRSEPEGPGVYAGLIIAVPLCCVMLPLMVLCPWFVIAASRGGRKRDIQVKSDVPAS